MAKLNKDGSVKKPRSLNCIVWIRPTEELLTNIVGNKEMKYSEFLKKIWSYWKLNKLNRIEILSK